MLWPRRSADRARHSLNQLLYQLRSVLGRDAITTHGELMRAGESLVADCVRFERALDTADGNDDAALALYGGPFLEAFPAPTPALAAWAEGRRQRYQALNREARRARLDALLEAGDRSGAIAAARAWAASEPRDSEPADRLAALLDEALGGRPTTALGPAPRPVPRPAARRPRSAVAALLVAALAGTIALVGLGIALSGDPAIREAAPDRVLVVGVVPFAGEPASPDPAAPHRAFLEAAEWLPGVAGAQAPALTSAGSAWDERGDTARLAAARARGMTYLVTGEIARPEQPGGLLTVQAWHVPSGDRILRNTTVPGEPPTDALARLSLSLVTAIADREDLSLGVPADILDHTRSPVAVAHFLRGRHLMSRGAAGSARDAFEAAVRADPGFAHARVRAGLAALWDGAPAVALRDTGAGLDDPGVEDLPRRLLGAIRLHAAGEAERAIAGFRAALALGPESPDANAGLALALHAHGATAGAGPEEAAEAYRRLLRLDPSYAPIHDRLFDLAIAAGDFASAADVVEHIRPESEKTVRHLVLDMLHGARSVRSAALDSMRWYDRDTVTAAFGLLVRAPGGLQMADSLGAILQQSIRTPSERARGADLRLMALAAMGRWEEAVHAWRRTTDPDALNTYITAVHLAGWPADELAAEVYRRAARALQNGTPHDARMARRILAHRATIHGDSAATLAALADLAHDPRGFLDGSDPEMRALDLALRARLHLLAGDSALALDALDAATAISPPMPAFPRPLACLAPQRLLALRLHLAASDTAAAERAARAIRFSPCPSSRLFIPALPALLRR